MVWLFSLRNKFPMKEVLNDIFEINNNLRFLRFRSCEELLEAAKGLTQEKRKKPASSSADILVPHVSGMWGATEIDKRFTSKMIVKAVAEIDELPIGHRQDEKCMNRFLSNSKLDEMVDPNIIPICEIIPCSLPLIDYLRVHCQTPWSWAKPSNDTVECWAHQRGLSYSYEENVDVREIIFGKSNEEDIQEFHDWISDQYDVDQITLPTCVISLDVRDMKVSWYDLLRITREDMVGRRLFFAKTLGAYEEDEISWFEDEDGRMMEDKWVSFPAKIIFGNGCSWAGVMSFEMEKDEDDYFIITCPDIQKSIVAILHDLPVCTGLKVKSNVTIIEETITLFINQEFKMLGPVDLECLAVLAGWRLESRHMTSMSMIALGAPMNNVCSKGDNSWGLRYQDLPHSLRVYAMGNIKFGFLTYNVLISLFLREMFPDPDIACYLSSCNQTDYISWFCVWIGQTLQNSAVFSPAVSVSVTRSDLLASLRYRTHRGLLSATPSDKVNLVIDLLPHWPTLTEGGPRFLQPVRERYLSQYQLLQEAQVFEHEKMFSVTITAAHRLYGRFGHLDIGEVDSKLGTDPATDTLGLVSHPRLKKQIFQVDTSSVSISSLLAEARRTDRGQREALYEWARLNVLKVDSLFDKYRRDVGFSKNYRSYYEDLRLIVMRSTNTAPSVVPGCEATIKRNQAEGLAKAKFRLEQLEREVIAQREIVAKFSKNFDLGESVKRTNWVRDFHSSSVLKRVGQKKRPRSSSRGYRSTSRSSRGSPRGSSSNLLSRDRSSGPSSKRVRGKSPHSYSRRGRSPHAREQDHR